MRALAVVGLEDLDQTGKHIDGDLQLLLCTFDFLKTAKKRISGGLVVSYTDLYSHDNRSLGDWRDRQEIDNAQRCD